MEKRRQNHDMYKIANRTIHIFRDVQVRGNTTQGIHQRMKGTRDRPLVLKLI
jgi:hypothetical protein